MTDYFGERSRQVEPGTLLAFGIELKSRNKVLLLAEDGAEPGCDPVERARTVARLSDMRQTFTACPELQAGSHFLGLGLAGPSPDQGLLHLPDIVEAIELEKCG
jgi:hypothetical protein